MIDRDWAMDEFVHRKNIDLFKKRLAEGLDEAAREVIQKLLAEEEAKLSRLLEKPEL